MPKRMIQRCPDPGTGWLSLYRVARISTMALSGGATRYKNNQPVPGSGQRWVLRFGI